MLQQASHGFIGKTLEKSQALARTIHSITCTVIIHAYRFCLLDKAHAVCQKLPEATPTRMIRTGYRGEKRSKECMQTCIACSTEDTVACWLEWQAAPADAASSSPKRDNSSEARSPLMLILRVFGRRASKRSGPFTFTTSCSSGT